MDEKTRCQSCGMPLGPGFYGTEADGTESHEYCKFCYQKGVFTEPDITLADMIKKSVHHMIYDLRLEDERAEVMANAIVPTLKRWR